LIIPPIPSKQTIGDYAIKQAKAREDAAMIARRKRMLQTFLNRIARHPILSNEHVFHRFLQGEVSWVCIQPCDKIEVLTLPLVGVDGGFAFAPYLPAPEKHSQSPCAQPN
jgi:hypothetical protein